MNFFHPQEYTGTSSLDLINKQPSTEELQETEGIYVLETISQYPSPRINELIRKAYLADFANAYDSLATLNYIHTSFESGLSTSAMVYEHFSQLSSDILIDEMIEYVPVSRHTVELKLVYRGDLSSDLKSDLEYDITDEQ